MCRWPSRGHPAAVLVSRHRPGGLWASSQRCPGSGLQREESCPGPGPGQGSPGPRAPHCLPVCLMLLSFGRPGYMESIMGRRRHLPRIRERDPQLRAQAERQAVNFVVQGTQSLRLACWVHLLLEFLAAAGLGDTHQIIITIFPLPVLPGSYCQAAVEQRRKVAGAQNVVIFISVTFPPKVGWSRALPVSAKGDQGPRSVSSQHRAKPAACTLDSGLGLSVVLLMPGRCKSSSKHPNPVHPQLPQPPAPLAPGSRGPWHPRPPAPTG